tara:strand:- start:10 stop:588 length:579 start_codon:yes stop_codon:yes gene_type:complete
MLNLSNNNGSGNSYIRFAPQANAWTNRDGEEIQLKKVVMDLDSVQTGWLMIGAGVRDWQPDETLGAKSQSPGEGYKRGFVVTLYSKELGLVDWSANAYGPCKGFEKIYNEADKAAGDNEGKLPVIEYVNSTAEKVGKGNTRVPNFKLVSWVARPAGMNAEDGLEQWAEPEPAPVRKASKPAPAPVMDDEEFF